MELMVEGDSSSKQANSSRSPMETVALTFQRLYKIGLQNWRPISICLIASLLFISLLLVTFGRAHHGGQFAKCQVLERAATNRKPLKAHDATARSLVSSSVNVQLFHNERYKIPDGYLELQLDRLELTDGATNEKLEFLAMYHKGCADLSLQIYHETQGSNIRANSWTTYWALRFNNNQVICSAELTMSWPNDTRYSCTKLRTVPCYLSHDRTILVAQFLFESLELELDGDPEYIAQKKFSKRAYPLSCSSQF